MFKFVLLSALACFALGAPAPGFLHGGYSLPAATSYSSRVDVVHSAPIVKTVVATPVIAKSVHYAAPVVASYGGYGLGSDLGHGYGYGLEHGIGLGHGIELGHGIGLEHGYSGIGYGHGW